MTTQQVTHAPTEADLEAQIQAVLPKAFPWLPAESIRHQTKFSFSFGGRTIEIDGVARSRAQARSDIVLYHGERPLAVMELKREGIPLTPQDEAQGLSYARVLVPSPPLVVVTNGVDVRYVETHSGKPWAPASTSEDAFAALLANAARIAAADLKEAIGTLMGDTPAVWMQGVRHASAETMQELLASWSEPGRPFVHDFLMPRMATVRVLRRIIEGSKLVLLQGAPLSGKSNVLRELCLRTEQSDELATLYVEADAGAGILQALADTLARSLAWPITREEARHWVARVSQGTDRKLLLAIDGLDLADDGARREIEDLSSTVFGPGVSLVVALDETSADKVVASRNGLAQSTIGRRASRIQLGPLNEREFEIAQRVLAGHRIRFMPGASAAPEYREPWVLRAVCAPLLERIEQAPQDQALALPPLLGLELIRQARARFTDHDLRRLFRGIASALLADAKDQARDASLVVEAIEVNMVRRATLRYHLEGAELNWLIDQGFLRPAMHASDEAVLYVRLPELLASELARLLADELVSLAREDAREAAAWIAGASSNLPMGDVVAAQAVVDAAERSGRLPYALVQAMLETAPERHAVSPGSRFAMHFPGVGPVELSFKEDGTAEVEINGEMHTIDIGEDDLSDTYAHIHEWLVLAHVASAPLVMDSGTGPERIDPLILLTVGAADVALRKPGGSGEMRAAPTHDIPGVGSIVCHQAGIIEPVTLSIFRFLMRERTDADAWIDTAIAKNSVPLLARIHIALLALAQSADSELAAWARAALDARVLPAFTLLPRLHQGSTESPMDPVMPPLDGQNTDS